MNIETPQISTSAYGSNSMMLGAVTDLGQNQLWNRQHFVADPDLIWKALSQNQPQQEQQKIMATTSRRIVQVFIADPNDNVPDATDAELFFEVPIAEILKAHNVKRVTWLDKDASKRSGKDVLLDPVKIRDLKMVVVDIAKF